MAAAAVARVAIGVTGASLLLATFFESEWSLFTLHPVGMVVWVWASTEGILALQRLRTQNGKRDSWTTHWVLQEVASVAAIGAFIAIFILKQNYHEAHFESFHSWAGLAVLLLNLFQHIGGYVMTFFPDLVGGRNKAVGLYKWHRLNGYLTFLFTYICFTFVFITNWSFHSTISNLVYFIAAASSIIAFAATLFSIDLRLLPFSLAGVTSSSSASSNLLNKPVEK